MDIRLETIETALLQWLTRKPAHDTRVGMVDRDFRQEALPTGRKPTLEDTHEAVWSLCRQGLIYLDYADGSFSNFRIRLTDAGKIAAQEGEYNPYHSDLFLQTFNKRVPTASDTVLIYLREALFSFKSECLLASAVMLGVASEAAFLEMANSFGEWLPDDESKGFIDIINSRRIDYIYKFIEFRKRITKFTQEINPELSDGMALTFDAVGDLLRIYRNNSGHPTGRFISKEDAYTNLQLAARYLHKLYQFKEWFESNPQGKLENE